MISNMTIGDFILFISNNITPTNITNRLYVVNNKLYFNGVQIGG